MQRGYWRQATKQPRTVKRFRLAGKTAGAVALFALLVLPFSSLAQADSGNLLPNGSFQSGTTGWTTSDAALTIASDGAGDSSAGRVAHNTTASSYQLMAKPRPVLSTTAGTLYTANGVVRSDTPGKSVCLLLKEFTSGGSVVLNSNACVTTTSQWAPLPQVMLTARSSGDQIAFLVKRSSGAVSGESFEVDTLSLVASGGGGGGGGGGSVGSVVGLWHLDETSGTTARDSSGHGHNGSIIGPITLGVPGVLNTAYSYTPKSAVEVPDAADLRPGTANVTISYWLNSTTLPPCCNGIDYDMFTKGDQSTSGGQIKLEVQENGQASCMFRGSAGKRQLISGPNVIDGRWHHVVCQRIGTQIIETVDSSSFSVTQATGSITVTAPIRIGSHMGGGDWYKGVLDEVSYAIG